MHGGMKLFVSQIPFSVHGEEHITVLRQTKTIRSQNKRRQTQVFRHASFLFSSRSLLHTLFLDDETGVGQERWCERGWNMEGESTVMEVRQLD